MYNWYEIHIIYVSLKRVRLTCDVTWVRKANSPDLIDIQNLSGEANSQISNFNTQTPLTNEHSWNFTTFKSYLYATVIDHMAIKR